MSYFNKLKTSPAIRTRLTRTTTDHHRHHQELLRFRGPGEKRNILTSTCPSLKTRRPTRDSHKLRTIIHDDYRGLFTGPSNSEGSSPSVLKVKLISFSKVVILITSLIGSYAYLTDTRASAHSWLTIPILQALTRDDPELAHKWAIKILNFLGRFHLIHDRPQPNDQALSFELWGKKFDNPIGLAAGFDKDGDAIDGLFDIGFGYVEIGSVTPQPQPGNPKPRMFRIPSTTSIINRYGFNSEGHFAVLSKLRHRILSFLEEHRHLGHSTILSRHDNLNPVQTAYADSGFTQLLLPSTPSADSLSLDQALGELSDELEIPRSLRADRVLAINLGKNKDSPQESIEDFKTGIERFGNLSDVLVINISSPNTPGLRNLQSKDSLVHLLNEVVATRNSLKIDSGNNPDKLPAILVKIAPDLSVQELVDVGTVAKEAKVDGIIISNTTVSRPSGSGTESEINQTGGLSGPPLKPLSLRALSIVYSATSGEVPLIGCGGISKAEDVLEYGRAGARFVQVYSALTYEGIGLARKLKDGLIELLEREEGSKKWSEVVGSKANRLDLEKLLEEERSKLASRSFEDQVREIKQSIEFIDHRISCQLAHPDPSQQDQSLRQAETPVGLQTLAQGSRKNQDSQALALVQDTTPHPNSSTSHRPHPDQDHQQHHHADSSASERGILAAWKLRRLREIESGDHKRIV